MCLQKAKEAALIPAGMRMMEDEERLGMLAALDSNKAEIEAAMQVNAALAAEACCVSSVSCNTRLCLATASAACTHGCLSCPHSQVLHAQLSPRTHCRCISRCMPSVCQLSMLQALPLRVVTFSQKAYKQGLEQRLEEVLEAIALFSRPKVLVEDDRIPAA